MVVIISSLDEVYVKLFDKIAFHLRAILPKRQIHHVGSTAVPGLAGKNIVDVLVSARDIHDIAAIKRRLQKAGFFPGSHSNPADGYVFMASRREETSAGDIHIHIAVAGTTRHDDFLLLRDYLRTHPEETKAYAAAKSAIVRDTNGDRNQYKLRKSKYVAELLGRAQRWKYNCN